MCDADYYDDEPTVVLLNGHRASKSVVGLVQNLLATGHTIQVSRRGDVSVSPPVHEDTLFFLDSNWQDVAAYLDAEYDPPSTLYVVDPCTTVH
jgi:hypothetical protein